MKKTLVAMAVLGTIAGAVQAQSTVTLYGRIDENLASFQTNAANGATGTVPAVGGNAAIAGVNQYVGIRKTAIQDGGFNGSRFGLKGSEDLGGGLSAIFNFEAGINGDAGSSTQGSTLMGRRMIVGLSSASWGTVGFGRNSSSYDDVAADHAMMEASLFDPSNTNNAPQTLIASGKTLNDVSAAFLTRTANTTWVGYSTRFNNSIKYQTPVMGGFSASAMYALGEDNTVGAAAKDATSTISANAKYVGGPLVVSVGYQSEALGGTQTTTSGAATVGANGNAAANAVGAAAGLKPALENTTISASYDLGMAKVGLGYNVAKFKDVIIGNGIGQLKDQNEYNLSVAVPFGATTLSAGYAVSQGDSLGKASGYGIQAKYAVSKRTFVYGGYNDTTLYDNLVSALNAAGSSVQHFNVFAVGIQHQF
jgi:predicted porin